MKLKIMLVLIMALCPMQQAYADGDKVALFNDCIDALKYDAELQPIRNKVALAGVSEQTFGMLANETTPTSDEALAIMAWATKREQCINSYPLTGNPYFAKINMDGYNSAQLLILELYKGNLSYGQFAKSRKETADRTLMQWQQMEMQLRTQGQQQQQYQQQYQQQQQQREEYLNQACLNRARNQFDVSNCNFESAGRQLGRAIINK